MISFQSDYNNGMLPEILEALGRTNDDKTLGYVYGQHLRFFSLINLLAFSFILIRIFS